MLGSWAWQEAVRISINKFPKADIYQDDILCDNPDAEGAMLVLIVAGSDKTTVSVVMGHHPVYAGPGNMDNVMQRLHSLGLQPIADRSTSHNKVRNTFSHIHIHSGTSTVDHHHP
jgi:Plavaka transposase